MTTGKPADRRHHSRLVDPPPTLQDALEEADRRHRERRQYDPDPSGWGDIPQPRRRRDEPDER